jgi:membrane-associated protein
MPVIKRNFSLVILGIIVVSVLPVIYEWYKARKEAARKEPEVL